KPQQRQGTQIITFGSGPNWEPWDVALIRMDFRFILAESDDGFQQQVWRDGPYNPNLLGTRIEMVGQGVYEFGSAGLRLQGIREEPTWARLNREGWQGHVCVSQTQTNSPADSTARLGYPWVTTSGSKWTFSVTSSTRRAFIRFAICAIEILARESST